MTKEKLMAVADVIDRTVKRDHEGRKTWNKVTGQWLVYGFETFIGFLNAAGLEGDVEMAWKKKQDVKQAAYKALAKSYGIKD